MRNAHSCLRTRQLESHRERRRERERAVGRAVRQEWEKKESRHRWWNRPFRHATFKTAGDVQANCWEIHSRPGVNGRHFERVIAFFPPHHSSYWFLFLHLSFFHQTFLLLSLFFALNFFAMFNPYNPFRSMSQESNPMRPTSNLSALLDEVTGSARWRSKSELQAFFHFRRNVFLVSSNNFEVIAFISSFSLFPPRKKLRYWNFIKKSLNAKKYLWYARTSVLSTSFSFFHPTSSSSLPHFRFCDFKFLRSAMWFQLKPHVTCTLTSKLASTKKIKK